MISYGECHSGIPSLIAKMLAEIISRTADFASNVVIENDPPYTALVVIDWKAMEGDGDGSLSPLIQIRIAIQDLHEPVRFYIEENLHEDASRLTKAKVEHIKIRLRNILGAFAAQFLHYAIGEKEVLQCNAHQLQSVNRLVQRWKRRPDEISTLGETIVVRYGNLSHQIETDGHTHS